ncbi:hypothetical protein [Intrasporangium sp. DVR]|uniref:hypothetical protein n=1 Tax=Intrasporangium sp. DVR TaxID=3127867 RepID=UPI00313A6244
MRKHLTALALGAAVLATGVPSAVAAETPTRPLQGWSAPAPDVYGAPVDCPEGTSWRYSQTGTAWLSHLGRVTFEITHCTVAPEGRFGQGTTVFTAANGDELWMEHWGTFQLDAVENPTRADATLSWMIVGGTGRFAGATGSGTGAAHTAITGPASGFTSGTWTGEIAYNGNS